MYVFPGWQCARNTNGLITTLERWHYCFLQVFALWSAGENITVFTTV